ncbi:oxidoreductase domain containing protein [Fonsecaea pedrosoi]|nr:oxidoreductase domain containing protein [Fonsecaea pedrosoi]
MELLAELESMALNILDVPEEGDGTLEADVARWQRLFGFEKADARRRIEEYRSDYSRVRISDELWATVKTRKEAEGYDREAYEYSLKNQPQALSPTSSATVSGTFIVQLMEPLDSPEKIKDVAGLAEAPLIVTGVGEHGQANFCQIDGGTRAKLLDWVAEHHSGFQPTIVRLTKAKKDLCSRSIAPTLAHDSTLPQNRLDDEKDIPRPSQDEYPVLYFFYGTLADPKVLKHHLNLDTEPSLVPASIQDGEVRHWGKYRALVDAPGLAKVFGSAFLVRSRDQEDALRFYETDRYEVVRCRIFTEDGVHQGLTFRFEGWPG